MVPEVAVERLRKVCDPATLPCRDSSEMKPLEAIIGQDRAVRSLRFGLEVWIRASIFTSPEPLVRAGPPPSDAS